MSNDQKPTSLWRLVRVPVLLTVALFTLQVVVKPLFMLEVPVGYGAAKAMGGSVYDGVYMPGPHFKWPWQHGIFMKLWTVAEARETTPTDSNNQPIGATVVPQVWIDPAAIPALARNYGTFDSLMKSVIDPQINQATRANTSLHTPEQLIWERPEVVNKIRASLQEAISEQLEAKGVDRNAVHIGLVAITQFGFAKPVRDTLEAKAESQVRTHTANAAARIRAIEADKNGQVTEITADGEAEYTRIIAEANAYKAQKLGEAATAASEVALYEAISKWVEAGGHSPRVQLGNGAQVIINGSGGTPTPDKK